MPNRIVVNGRFTGETVKSVQSLRFANICFIGEWPIEHESNFSFVFILSQVSLYVHMDAWCAKCDVFCSKSDVGCPTFSMVLVRKAFSFVVVAFYHYFSLIGFHFIFFFFILCWNDFFFHFIFLVSNVNNNDKNRQIPSKTRQ